MDKIDSQILEALQNDFPLVQNPYDVIAEKLDIGPEELFDRVENMKKDEVIRRIGVSLDSRKLGYSSTLAAVSVASELVEKASGIIARYTEVTHSYLRSDSFNIWFTLITVNDERIEEILKEIQKELNLADSQVLNLPVTRLFKLNARFEVK